MNASQVKEYLSFIYINNFPLQGEKMVLVACGWRHTISISSSGSLFTYGWSKYGQLGHGDFEDHLIPHKLEALRDHHISQVIAFAASHTERSMFLRCTNSYKT